jgi:protein associated with RNAse G/E
MTDGVDDDELDAPDDADAADEWSDGPVAVRVRGIYSTALTRLLSGDDETRVVQASSAIRERFDAPFPTEPAEATVSMTDDRQGVAVLGGVAAVGRVVDRVRVARDTLVWRDPTPRGGVYAGEVTETLGGGAVVALADASDSGGASAGTDAGTGDSVARLDRTPAAGRDPEGFLPYSKTANRVEEGDRLRVQVTEASAPWTGGRPVLDTTVRIHGPIAMLLRGGATGSGVGNEGPELADLLAVDPPTGWTVEWSPSADDADLDALGAALDRASDRAAAVDAAFADADPPDEVAPHCYWSDETTAWAWFGRESKFALDDRRRRVTATMPGHHRTKAATGRASAAVDFLEAVCPDATGTFPFDAVTRQFGPKEGDTVAIEHGKPEGRSFSLGEGEVTRRDADGTVVVERELSGRGTYDALGVAQQQGDVAVTKFTEGKWWYPTVYRGADGEKRGTYVNVCTPVEVFPSTVRYVDLHVDVVKHADGTVERVDDDELDAAVDARYVPDPLAEKARHVAGAVESAL